jgi:hypothetical protein
MQGSCEYVYSRASRWQTYTCTLSLLLKKTTKSLISDSIHIIHSLSQQTPIPISPYTKYKNPNSRPVSINHALPNNHPPPCDSSGLCSSPSHHQRQPERQPECHRSPRGLRQIDFLRRQRPRRNLLLLNLQTPRRPLRHGFQRASLGQRRQLRRVCEGFAWGEVDCCDGEYPKPIRSILETLNGTRIKQRKCEKPKQN